jgi:transketolase
VVSIPSLDLLLSQDPRYRERLFPPGVRVATVEAGITAPWRILAGLDGLTLGIDRFGASAPYPVLAEKLGFTAESVASRLRDWLGGAR